MEIPLEQTVPWPCLWWRGEGVAPRTLRSAWNVLLIAGPLAFLVVGKFLPDGPRLSGAISPAAVFNRTIVVVPIG